VPLPPTARFRPSRSGFTLLELSVVIAILAFLMVLLFSVGGTLRAQSETSRCIANLRNIGSMLFAYAAERNGMLPPGFSGDATDHIVRDAKGKVAKGWPRRLAAAGYALDESVFLCPSFFPRNTSQLRRPPFEVDASEAYGMRSWTVPDSPSYNTDDLQPHKPLAVIENPADFFLVADSYWSASNWRSQGYTIHAARLGTPASNRIHLRHNGRANALFADGHIEAKEAEYFQNLHQPGRQPRYIGGKRGGMYGFTVEVNPPAPVPAAE